MSRQGYINEAEKAGFRIKTVYDDFEYGDGGHREKCDRPRSHDMSNMWTVFYTCKSVTSTPMCEIQGNCMEERAIVCALSWPL